MKSLAVGTFDLWGVTIHLKLREGQNADFLQTFDGKPMVMRIGADVECWQNVVGLLLHEVKEFTDMQIGCRYVVTADAAKDNSSYLFVETHTQHSEVCARIGWFLADCLPALETAWKKWKKQQKKGKK